MTAPKTTAAALIERLQAEPGREFLASELADAVGCQAKTVGSHLEAALDRGLVYRRQRDRTSIRAPYWYSATDHASTQRHAGFAALQAWMAPQRDLPQGDQAGSEPAREVMEPEVCESADGRGTTGAPALATLPLHASPGVGPMGAGQPADAGPTTDDQRSGGGGARPAAAGCTGTDGSPLRGPSPGRHSQDAGAAPGPLHHDEQPRQVDEQFARSLRAAMGAGAEDCLARGAELGRRRVAPLAFRAARFSDGSLHFERHGQVIASLTADEVDVLVQLLGART